MSKENEDKETNLDHLEYDGLSPLEQDAASMHELFLALTGTGFTEDQGLRLTAYLADSGSTTTVSITDSEFFDDDEDTIVFEWNPELTDDED
jgi:hypothetical protein